MIPADIRLFSWVDIEEVLLREQEAGNWPDGLLVAHAYWDTLELMIQPKTRDEVADWLEDLFSPRYNNGEILFESPKGTRRTCRITFDETEQQPAEKPFQPTLTRPKLVTRERNLTADPSPFPDGSPSLIVLHSFKGGVGRTLHTLAIAREISRRNHKVLLIDGDFEAPGLSWLLEKKMPEPPACYADFLAMAHADEDPDRSTTIDLMAEKLANAKLDSIFVLPAFRSKSRWNTLEIRPEHLLNDKPFILADLLVVLGKRIGADAVIVDLRAGLSELSTGLLLDPRAQRILVTSPSSQSISGTCSVLKAIAKYAPARTEDHPTPVLINSLVLAEIASDPDLTGETDLREAAVETVVANDNVDEIEIPILTSTFEQNLLYLPLSWDKVMEKLERSNLLSTLSSLVSGLDLSDAHGEPLTGYSDLSLRDRRLKLKETAEKLEYAEKSDGQDFLVTTPLANLIEKHANKLPNVVMIGAKGSGKTFSFLQMVKHGCWGDYTKGSQDTTISDAAFFPILPSANLEPDIRALLEDAENRLLGQRERLTTTDLKDMIRTRINSDTPLHEGQWRDFWLDSIAWRLGFEPRENGSGRRFLDRQGDTDTRVIVLIDGLEDIFSSIAKKDAEKVAVRALIQDLPEWLAQHPSQQLGIIVFIRQDIVDSAIIQNKGQFTNLYRPYLLKWSEEEALRLVVWLCIRASLMTEPSEGLDICDTERLQELLIPIWGRKLGSQKSKEARTARWVIDALSDLNQQVQARDLVRLVKESAAISINDSTNRWNDRLLTPGAIKNSLDYCSRHKIEEIKQENLELKEIFETLEALPDKEKTIPIERDKLELKDDQIETLTQYGVILQSGNEFLMAEIFWRGLGFTSTKRGKSGVLSLKRKARGNKIKL